MLGQRQGDGIEKLALSQLVRRRISGNDTMPRVRIDGAVLLL
jgi:hypothetical protein